MPERYVIRGGRQGYDDRLRLLARDRSTLDATCDAIVGEHVASAGEVEAALADLAAFTADPTTLISGPRIFQVWTRRAPSERDGS